MNLVEEWHADIAITEELVGNCLQEQFPDLMPIKKIQYDSEGWDNKVYLINDKIIFRFPRRKIAVELIEQENKVLTKLPKFHSVHIPLPNYIGQPSARYPYPFHGYELIKGKPAYQAQLSEAERIASLNVMANFLKQLHSIKEQQAIAFGAQKQPFDRTIVTKAVNTLSERVNKIIERKICDINFDLFQQEINTALQLQLPFDDMCLVHGDIDSRHMIFNAGQLVGIIDWGDMGINNKAADLEIIWDFYPSSCHKEFFKIYGEVDSITWQYARFLGLYSAFTHILYGADIGDDLLAAEAVGAVKRINKNLLPPCQVS